jgi:hypothetical protein
MVLLSITSLFADDQLWVAKKLIDQVNSDNIVLPAAATRISEQINAQWFQSTWINTSRNRYTYVENTQLDMEYEDAASLSGWDDYRRWNYVYGTSGNLDAIIGEFLNGVNWDSLDRKVYVNDDQDRVMEITRDVYTFPGWYPTQREIYEYNPDGLVSKLYFQGPYSPTEWYYEDLVESSYNGQGLKNALIYYYSQDGDTNWTPSSKLDYTYDENNIETEELFSIWNAGDSTWIPASRTINTIVEGKVTEKLYQSFYGVNWEDTGRDLYEYNPDGTLLTMTYQQYYSSNWNNTLKTTYVYEPVSAISGNYQAQVLDNYMLYDNYPNPFNPVTNIRFYLAKSGPVNIQVYNVQGKSVATIVNKAMTAGEHTVTFNASALASGVYLYRLTTGDGFTAIKRLVLLK